MVLGTSERPVQLLHGRFRPDLYKYEMKLSRSIEIDVLHDPELQLSDACRRIARGPIHYALNGVAQFEQKRACDAASVPHCVQKRLTGAGGGATGASAAAVRICCSSNAAEVASCVSDSARSPALSAAMRAWSSPLVGATKTLWLRANSARCALKALLSCSVLNIAVTWRLSSLPKTTDSMRARQTRNVIASARTVFSLESYIGLVEAGVGLLPAGGGLKEIATRVGLAAGQGGDVFAGLRPYFEAIAMGKVSASALEAKELKLARENDVVIFNAFELLHVAKQQVKALAESGYRPALPARQIPVAGDVGIATFKMMLVNMLEGRFISEHDMEVSTRIATVLCGGDVDRGSLVDEEWLLKLEREHFIALALMPKTQERILYMLQNGKPLRN